jgi:predicted DNA-binding protein (UPF0251 family)
MDLEIRDRYHQDMTTVIPVDPFILAQLGERQATDEWLPEGEATQEQHERIADLLDHLDELDAQVVDLCLLRGCSQVQSAQIMGVSQATVWARLKTALGRLRYWASLPPCDLRRLRKWLSEPPWGAAQRDFLLATAEEGSIVQASRVLGLSAEPWQLRRRLQWMLYLPLPTDALARFRYVLDKEPRHISRNRDYLAERGKQSQATG